MEACRGLDDGHPGRGRRDRLRGRPHRRAGKEGRGRTASGCNSPVRLQQVRPVERQGTFSRRLAEVRQSRRRHPGHHSGSGSDRRHAAPGRGAGGGAERHQDRGDRRRSRSGDLLGPVLGGHGDRRAVRRVRPDLHHVRHGSALRVHGHARSGGPVLAGAGGPPGAREAAARGGLGRGRNGAVRGPRGAPAQRRGPGGRSESCSRRRRT